MDKNEQKLKLKNMNLADRPREKLLALGRKSLSDAELLAILLGTGNATENAVELSKRILGAYKHDLYEAGKASLNDLCRFNGIGEVKALSIIAALELGRRRREYPEPDNFKITCSRDLFNHLHTVFEDLNHEEFWVVILNKANMVKGKFMISKGGMGGTIADPKIIFTTALQQNAASLILAHNHPSGNLNPSQEDIHITRKLIEVGKLLEMPVLDHLIVTNSGYISLADEGII
jgi:DNA repair protein RadC